MEIVIGLFSLAGLGGMQSYSLAVAATLERLGHDVTIVAGEDGAAGALVRERGLRLHVGDAAPGVPADAVIVQDAAMALRLAEQYPDVPRVMVMHGAELDVQRPPQLDGVVSVVVALNDRVARRLASLAVAPEVHRLRQPIDLVQFSPAGPLPQSPRRALLLGNHLAGPRRKAVIAACEEIELEWRHAGAHGEVTTQPERAIADAHIVIGYGRSILEAMASGRAAYVFDWGGGDGWVTADTYRTLEADGFAGLARDEAVDAGRLASDLLRYKREMGLANRDLARRHHNVHDHATELVGLMGRAGARGAPRGASAEMERLVRREHTATAKLVAATQHLEDLRGRLEAAEERASRAEARAAHSEASLAQVVGTRRWRLAGLVAAPLDRLRAALRRRR